MVKDVKTTAGTGFQPVELSKHIFVADVRHKLDHLNKKYTILTMFEQRYEVRPPNWSEM